MSVRLAIARTLVAAFVLYTVGCVLAPLHWTAELLTHFRVQAAIGGALVALLCAALRMPGACLVSLGLTAVHVVPLLPYLAPESAPQAAVAPRVRLLQVNVHTANREHEAVVELVETRRPDILALLEVNERWLGALSGLHTYYPHRIESPREDNFGIALFGRFPLEDLRLLPLGPEGLEMIAGRFALGPTPVALVVAHPVPPASAAYAALRNQQLRLLSDLTRRLEASEVILLGDLNVTPWSPEYQRFERSSGLRNGARGLGLFPTWPTGMPLLMIPIDHCLLSPGLRAVSLETGPEVGSDHLPVLLEVQLRAGTRSSGAARAWRSAATPRRG